MKKIDKKQIFLVIVLIGVVACLLIYMLVFTKYRDLTEQLKTSNATLRRDVEDMKQYYDNIDLYRSEKSKMIDLIPQMTADYPGDAREEDVVMMAVGMQTVAIMHFDQINIAEPESIHNVPVETVEGAAIEGLDEEIDFMLRQATYTSETTYSSFKNAVAKVYESPYRIGVNSVAFRKDADTNNIITGTIDINYYSLKGMDKEYKLPEMPSYAGGSMDLFGLQHWAITEEEMGELIIFTDGSNLLMGFIEEE